MKITKIVIVFGVIVMMYGGSVATKTILHHLEEQKDKKINQKNANSNLRQNTLEKNDGVNKEMDEKDTADKTFDDDEVSTATIPDDNVAQKGHYIRNFIGKGYAKKIALEDAKLYKKNVVFTKVRLVYMEQASVYNIAFQTSTLKYEYVIDAKTAAIQKKGKKKIEQTSKESTSYISEQKAIDIVLHHAKLHNKDVVIKKVKLGNELGVVVYKVKFYHGNTKFEYLINANTHTIMEWKKDTD